MKHVEKRQIVLTTDIFVRPTFKLLGLTRALEHRSSANNQTRIYAPFIHQCQLAELLLIEHADGCR